MLAHHKIPGILPSVWLLPLALLVATAGCRTMGYHQAAGTAMGTLSGTAMGAAIGSHQGKSVEGALIGALAGGATGNAVGQAVDRQEGLVQAEIDRQRAAAQERALGLQEILQMHHSGMGESIIARQIQLSGLKYPFSLDDLIELRNQGLADQVIEACQIASASGGPARLVARPVGIVEERVLVPTPPIAVPYPIRPAPRCCDDWGWGLHVDW